MHFNRNSDANSLHFYLATIGFDRKLESLIHGTHSATPGNTPGPTGMHISSRARQGDSHQDLGHITTRWDKSYGHFVSDSTDVISEDSLQGRTTFETKIRWERRCSSRRRRRKTGHSTIQIVDHADGQVLLTRLVAADGRRRRRADMTKLLAGTCTAEHRPGATLDLIRRSVRARIGVF